MVKNENFIMQATKSKTLQELNLTDDFLFDVITEELENCKAIIELTTGLRLKSLKWKSGQKVIHNLPGKRGVRLDFIAECRNGKTHTYDIVEGPMANDTVWNYVNDYLTGRINRKQFWALAEFKYPTHQISFHTLSALDCLTYRKSEVVYDSKGTK